VKRNAVYYVVLLAGLAIAVAYVWWQGRIDHSQDGRIRAAAARYGMEAALIKAVAWRESRFNASARGRAGEIGVMQLREDAAREWADAEHIANWDHEQCVDATTNIYAGTWYLRKVMRRYTQTDNPIAYALADYNAGRGNVLKWNGGEAATNSTRFIEQIGFPSTRDYVQTVLERYQQYRSGF
jgi:soluble lytic murein transglycosylase